MFLKNKVNKPDNRIGPPGCTTLKKEDRQHILKVIAGDTWVVSADLYAADGGPATPKNSYVDFVLSENQFSSPIWTGEWFSGVLPDENREGLVHIQIPREVSKKLRRGSYSFSLRVSDLMRYSYETEMEGQFLVEYAPTSDQHSIPYRDGTSDIFNGGGGKNPSTPTSSDELETVKKVAQDAQKTAELANKTASSAETKADEAKQDAAQAEQNATEAVTEAQKASADASSAVATSGRAEGKADNAIQTADSAAQSASAAENVANQADSKAEEALTTAQQANERALQNAQDIAGIEAKIPTQASDQNQLADKEFVNSSVATNTANYIYKTNAQNKHIPFDSYAELTAYSGPLTNNDYAFVVGTDASGNTTYTRYKYKLSTQTWAEEYVLNNSSFTANQWAAISSGITSGLVEKLGDLPTATDLANALMAKYEKPLGGIPKTDLENNVQTALDKATSSIQGVKRNGTALTPTDGVVNVEVPTQASDISAVPNTRTVNGEALSSDVVLTGEDINVSDEDPTTIATKLASKQDKLSQTQLDNIDAVPNKQDKLSQTQLDNIDAVPNKQDKLSQTQLDNIDAVPNKQDALSQAQLDNIDKVASLNVIDIDDTTDTQNPAVNAVKAHYPKSNTYAFTHQNTTAENQKYTRAGFSLKFADYLAKDSSYVAPLESLYHTAYLTIDSFVIYLATSSTTTACLLVRERNSPIDYIRSNSFTIGTSAAQVAITFPENAKFSPNKPYDFWFVDASTSNVLGNIAMYMENNFPISNFEVIGSNGARAVIPSDFLRGHTSLTVVENYEAELAKTQEAELIKTALSDLSRAYSEWYEPLADVDQASGYNLMFITPSAFGATNNCIIRAFSVKTANNADQVPKCNVYAKLIDIDNANEVLAVSRPVYMSAASTEYLFIFNDDAPLTPTKKYRIDFMSSAGADALPVNVAMRLSAAQSEAQGIYYANVTNRRPIIKVLYAQSEVASIAFVTSAVSNKASKVAGATAGNLASLDANGNLADAGYHLEVRNGIPCIVQYT